MNPWSFVGAAYGAAIGLTALLLLSSFLFMRRAEGAAEAISRK